MIFQQELYTLWASLELFMALTHLFVFLGVRNSKLSFLRRQHNYFLLDAATHFVNLFLFPLKDVGLVLYTLWIVAVVIHLYYYMKLRTNPPPKRTKGGETAEDNAHKIPRIFHWSCVEFQGNRFSIVESGRQILETTIDVTAHTSGFLLAFRMLQSTWYQLAALVLMSAIFYQKMLTLKYFFTEPKMMPPQLQRLFAAFSTNSVSN